jgi:hypothetical protein
MAEGSGLATWGQLEKATDVYCLYLDTRRRHLGPLGWTVLQHLALNSRSTDRGWVVGVGVRHIAAGLGVTKDTAAHWVSALVAAGLVSLGRVPGLGGRQRSGYLLHLLEPMRLIDRPDQLHRRPVLS